MRGAVFDVTAKSLPALITIQRGVTRLRWTTGQEPVTIGVETWEVAAGAKITALQFDSDGKETNCDLIIHARTGGPVEPGDGARGLLDGWPITIEFYDADDPEGTVTEISAGSIVGSVTEDANGVVAIAASGQLIKGDKYVTEHYSLIGREDLGDDRCKIPIKPADIGRGVDFVRPDIVTGLLHVNDAYGRKLTGSPESYGNVYYECTVAGTTDTVDVDYDPTVGNSTVDGTATFIARDAWLREATGEATGVFTIVLDSLPDSRASDATWYVLGSLWVKSGVLEDYPRLPIRAWDPGTLTVTLFLPIAIGDIPAGTEFEIAPGCDNTREMCYSRFNNIVNLRAETFVPPPMSQF